MTKKKSSVPPTEISTKILEALRAVGAMTTTELGLYLCNARQTIAQHIRSLRKEPSVLRISGWVFPEGRGRASPQYDLKKGPLRKDVPKPTQTTAEQKRKRYRKDKLRVSLQRNGGRSKSSRVNNIFGVYLGKKDDEEESIEPATGDRPDDDTRAKPTSGLDSK